MKKQLFFFCLLAFAALANAQVVKNHQPDSLIKAIPFDAGPHSGYLFTVGGKLQTPFEIKARLLGYAPSAAEYTRARRDFTWGFVLSGASAAAAFGAIASFAHDNRLNNAAFNSTGTGFVYQEHNKTGAYILSGAAVGFLTAAVTTWVNGAIHGNKSIHLYNQQYE